MAPVKRKLNVISNDGQEYYMPPGKKIALENHTSNLTAAEFTGSSNDQEDAYPSNPPVAHDSTLQYEAKKATDDPSNNNSSSNSSDHGAAGLAKEESDNTNSNSDAKSTLKRDRDVAKVIDNNISGSGSSDTGIDCYGCDSSDPDEIESGSDTDGNAEICLPKDDNEAEADHCEDASSLHARDTKKKKEKKKLGNGKETHSGRSKKWADYSKQEQDRFKLIIELKDNIDGFKERSFRDVADIFARDHGENFRYQSYQKAYHRHRAEYCQLHPGYPKDANAITYKKSIAEDRPSWNRKLKAKEPRHEMFIDSPKLGGNALIVEESKTESEPTSEPEEERKDPWRTNNPGLWLFKEVQKSPNATFPVTDSSGNYGLTKWGSRSKVTRYARIQIVNDRGAHRCDDLGECFIPYHHILKYSSDDSEFQRDVRRFGAQTSPAISLPSCMVSRTSLERYMQCIYPEPLTKLPQLEIVPGKQKARQILYDFNGYAELYLAASYFGTTFVMDMVIDSWTNLTKSHDLNFTIAEMNRLLDLTEGDDLLHAFLIDLIATKGEKAEIWMKAKHKKAMRSADTKMSRTWGKDWDEYLVYHLNAWDDNTAPLNWDDWKQICKKYHHHSTGECYRDIYPRVLQDAEYYKAMATRLLVNDNWRNHGLGFDCEVTDFWDFEIPKVQRAIAKKAKKLQWAFEHPKHHHNCKENDAFQEEEAREVQLAAWGLLDIDSDDASDESASSQEAMDAYDSLLEDTSDWSAEEEDIRRVEAEANRQRFPTYPYGLSKESYRPEHPKAEKHPSDMDVRIARDRKRRQLKKDAAARQLEHKVAKHFYGQHSILGVSPQMKNSTLQTEQSQKKRRRNAINGGDGYEADCEPQHKRRRLLVVRKPQAPIVKASISPRLVTPSKGVQKSVQDVVRKHSRPTQGELSVNAKKRKRNVHANETVSKGPRSKR